MASMAMMARALVVAVRLMQCCSVMILAARPLLDSSEHGGRQWTGQGGALIMQVLPKGKPSCNWNSGVHPGCPP
jgi:hypothetical protein